MNLVEAPASLLRPTEKLQEADGALLELLNKHTLEDDDFWSSKDRDRNDSAHGIFQYPAMMVPIVQRRLLAAVRQVQPNAASLYDPFVGAGTSLVSAMHFGMKAYGNDINPLAVLISRVRTSQETNPHICDICEDVANFAVADKSVVVETVIPNLNKWFKPDVALELSRLRRAIRRQTEPWVRQFLWVALAETVRLTSNDRTSTYKLHARPKEEIVKRNLSPVQVFKNVAKANADSIASFREQLSSTNKIILGKYISKTEVRLIDTRENLCQAWGGGGKFDTLMTSPPYGDNHTTVTYGQHSYLPLHWIDLEDIDSAVDSSTLRTTQEIDRRSLGGKGRLSDKEIERILLASRSLQDFSNNLPKKPSDGRDRLLRFYIDFFASLGRIVDLIKTNGYMVWTVGNRSIAGKQVPTDKILCELLEGLGARYLNTLTRTIHHKRMPDRNASSATMREEKIVIFRKVGVNE